jgi:hypothetical protein
VATEALMAALAFVVVWRVSRAVPSARNLSKTCLAALAMAGILFSGASLWHWEISGGQLVMLLLAGLAGYAVILFGTGAVSKKDLGEIMQREENDNSKFKMQNAK